MIEVVFETHATTLDNERGIATGWLPGELSDAGMHQARALGDRRRRDGLAAVFTSDLARATETARIAFAATDVPILHDWRLRECDYGASNGTSSTALDRPGHLDVPYQNGESWREAVGRVVRAIDDLPTRWNGARVLLIGHVATKLALDHVLGGESLEALIDRPFEWREGWEYRAAP